MDSFMEIYEEASDKVRMLIQDWSMVRADEIGLDRRAGYSLWISDEGIITTRDSDRSLQYYGGFEYVDKDYRMELGDWVFYSAEDDRVQDCLDTHFGIALNDEVVED